MMKMKPIFPQPETVLVPIVDSNECFPVRRVYCVGRNYLAHAREMGADEREPPFFFTKFPDTIVKSGATLRYPRQTKDFQFEGELVIAIGAKTSQISVENALNSIAFMRAWQP